MPGAVRSVRHQAWGLSPCKPGPTSSHWPLSCALGPRFAAGALLHPRRRPGNSRLPPATGAGLPPGTVMLTGCEECSICPRNPEQWYAPLWLASACGMEKLEFVWANHLGFPSWKNVILYRRQFLQLWHRSTMVSPCGTSRRGVWSSSQAGGHRGRRGAEAGPAARVAASLRGEGQQWRPSWRHAAPLPSGCGPEGGSLAESRM